MMSSRSGAPGPFIYSGSGRKKQKDDEENDIFCRKESCDIQMCLARNNSMEKYCQNYIDHWKECVAKAKALKAEKNNSKV